MQENNYIQSLFPSNQLTYLNTGLKANTQETNVQKQFDNHQLENMFKLFSKYHFSLSLQFIYWNTQIEGKEPKNSFIIKIKRKLTDFEHSSYHDN